MSYPITYVQWRLEHVCTANFAQHGDTFPVRGIQGASRYSGNWHKDVPIQTTRLNRIKNLLLGIRARRLVRLCFPSCIRPIRRDCIELLTPKSGIFFKKKILWELTWPNVLKLNWGILEYVLMLSCARHGEWSPVMWIQNATPILLMDRFSA